MEDIFIPYNTPSSKNGKRLIRKGLIINSKTVMKYKQLTHDDWTQNRDKFLSLLEGKTAPYQVRLYFVRNSRRKFDYINIAQIVFDLMQEYKWLPDDCADYVIPQFRGYKYDKIKPGVYINVLDNEPDSWEP